MGGVFASAHKKLSEIDQADIDLLDCKIELLASVCANRLKSGGTIYFMGNGGSAADAQHWAAELVGRFLVERQPLRARSLSVDPSLITALGNDYGFNAVFSRQLAAFATDKDVVIGITTSGKSENIQYGVQEAMERGAYAVVFTGLAELSYEPDAIVRAPFHSTPRIQEVHAMLGHALCDQIEAEFNV